MKEMKEKKEKKGKTTEEIMKVKKGKSAEELMKDKKEKSTEKLTKDDRFWDDAERFPLFNRVKNDRNIRIYIGEQNKSMKAMGYTEHGLAHITVVSERVAYILNTLGMDDHTIDLALTAAWMHDLGNVINRVNHSESGALMAFYLLDRMGVPAEDIAPVIQAIGNHDEGSGVPVSSIAAALILADKSDVRRSRVQDLSEKNYDIHDRVNYSAASSRLKINQDHTAIKLKLEIDTRYGEIGEYFEIFMDRMLLCRKAAEYLKLEFHLIINEQTLM